MGIYLERIFWPTVDAPFPCSPSSSSSPPHTHFGRRERDVSPILKSSGRASRGPHRKLDLWPLQFRGHSSLGSSIRLRNIKVGRSSPWQLSRGYCSGNTSTLTKDGSKVFSLDQMWATQDRLAAEHSLDQWAHKVVGENAGGVEQVTRC